MDAEDCPGTTFVLAEMPVFGTEMVGWTECPTWAMGMPCALDWLFGKHGRVSGGLEIPKPYVISTAATDGDMVVGLTLFGFAGDLAETIAEAMVRALRSGLNDGTVERVHYRPLDIRSRTLSVCDGVPVMAPPPGAVLAVTLRPPMSIRDGDRIKAVDFGDLVSAATHRVQGITCEEEDAAQAALANAEDCLDGRLRIVTLPHGRTATVMDRIAAPLPGDAVANVLIFSPGEVNFFGTGPAVTALNAAFPDGFSGGDLPHAGFWGHAAPTPPRPELLRVLGRVLPRGNGG